MAIINQTRKRLRQQLEMFDRTRKFFAALIVIAAVYWRLAYEMIDGMAYTISASLAAFSIVVAFATWTWLDRRERAHGE